MKVIGITGGIGSGKTLIAQVLEALGYPVFNSDTEAKNLYELEEVKHEVAELLGDDVLEDGVVSKSKIASKVFNQPEKLKALNNIIHPRVARLFQNWKEKNKNYPFVFKESALLLQIPNRAVVDDIIIVHAPKSIRFERVKKRDDRSEEEILDIMDKQLSDEEFQSAGDFVIINDGKPVLEQVLSLVDALKED